MIHLKNLTYYYPNHDQPAIQGINWQIEEGSFVLVTGHSGSGKSTLLRCLNGLVPHFSGGQISGEVTVNGVSVISAGPQVMSQLVGFVSQNPESQTVLEQVESEIAFALENAAIPTPEMRVRVEETLDLLELMPLRGRPIRTLSGGEKQRVAIASALSLRPSILVLDEPTSQLDPQSADEVLRALVRLNEDLGLTIILAEHRLERIIRYSDRIVYMEAGSIINDAPVREALWAMPYVPPLVQIAKALQWNPLPVTVKEGRRYAQRITIMPQQPDSDEDKRQVTGDNSPAALNVTGLNFSYDNQPVLKNVNLHVVAGEAVALIGRNGAGKTTLLKCIVGLLTANSGMIQINGRSIKGRPVYDICREVAYLPQNPDDLLYAETVEEELFGTLRNHGLAGTINPLNMLQSLGLEDVADKYPRDLSIGQRQRVAIGAVTVTHPRILLLDEPSRGLDLLTKESLVFLWEQWLANGAAILLVTHDVELAAKLATRTMILSGGEVISSGQTADVLRSSPHFAPQVARLFPEQRWLTVKDALNGLGLAAAANTI